MQLSNLVSMVAAASSESIPDKLGINFYNLIFQAIGFALLLFLLYRFAYGPLLKIIDERRARAQEIVDKSDQIRKDLADTEARSRAELDKAREEAQTIITEARATKDRIVGEAREAAIAAAAQETARAREEFMRERETAITDLRHQTADLAIAAATRVLGRELSTSKELQTQLINDALANADIKSSGNGRGSY